MKISTFCSWNWMTIYCALEWQPLVKLSANFLLDWVSFSHQNEWLQCRFEWFSQTRILVKITHYCHSSGVKTLILSVHVTKFTEAFSLNLSVFTSHSVWIRNGKWWGLMKPRDSVIMEILIRFSCQRGSKRDPDTRAEGSVGTDQEWIWRSEPNTRAWARWGERGMGKGGRYTRTWACWGERGLEKGETDARARDKWSPIHDTSIASVVEISKSLNGTLTGLKRQKYSLQPSQRNSKQFTISVSLDNGICSKLF